MSIRKIRDSSFLCGQHDYVIETGGVTVFPRIVPREQYRDFVLEPVSRGIEGMDILLGGGLDLHRGQVGLRRQCSLLQAFAGGFCAPATYRPLLVP
jgi:hypothetical protein